MPEDTTVEQPTQQQDNLPDVPPDLAEQNSDITESFDDFSKRMDDGSSTSDIPTFGFDQTAKKETKEVEPTSTEGDDDAGKKAEPEKKPMDSMSKFKKRIERERNKAAAKDAEIERLKKELEQSKSPPSTEPDTPKPETGAQAEPEPEPQPVEIEITEPEPDDYENDDAYIDALADYYDKLDEIEARQEAGVQSEETGTEPKEPEKAPEPQQAPENQEVLEQQPQEQQQWSPWNDLFEVLDEAEVESETLSSDFYDGLSKGQIQMSNQMLDWMLDNEEQAHKVAEKFIDSPRTSRRIARLVGSKQTAELKKLIDGRRNPKPKQPDISDMSKAKGTDSAPASPLESDMDFDEFEKRMEEEQERFNRPFDIN